MIKIIRFYEEEVEIAIGVRAQASSGNWEISLAKEIANAGYRYQKAQKEGEKFYFNSEDHEIYKNITISLACPLGRLIEIEKTTQKEFSELLGKARKELGQFSFLKELTEKKI